MSNLPPDVRESDIPGNRPEDIVYEGFWDSLILAFPEVEWLETEEAQKVIDWVASVSYKHGYDDGSADAAQAFGWFEQNDI